MDQTGYSGVAVTVWSFGQEPHCATPVMLKISLAYALAHWGFATPLQTGGAGTPCLNTYYALRASFLSACALPTEHLRRAAICRMLIFRSCSAVGIGIGLFFRACSLAARLSSL